MVWRRGGGWAAALLLAAAPQLAAAGALPADVERALARAQVPEQALAVVVMDAASGRVLLSHNAQQPMNPASLAKLYTTGAALDLLGPAWTWATPVWVQGPVRDGVLDGAVHLRGSGDPKLVIERLWLLLRRLQHGGVREIRGDIVVDNSAFAPVDGAPEDFDGEALRPYNVRPEALLLNFKSVVYTFVPEPARGVAQVLVEPPMAGVQVDRTVPLAAGPCDDWRAQLKGNVGDPARVRFGGSYPTACGEQQWPVADPQPASYNARALAGLWREMGGTLTGRVREGPAPTPAAPTFEVRSAPLLDTIRDINKYSNNVMAQQLFLTLALQRDPSRPATTEAARDVVRRWLASWGADPVADLVLDNGSGLSRDGRSTAQLMARVLQHLHNGPWAAEFASSLPVAGVDGTLRRMRVAPGRAHLKTGSLRDVAGLAGYVLGSGGRRLVLVAVVNHPQARAARPALDALVQWALRDPPAR